MTEILCIDPGPVTSGVVEYSTETRTVASADAAVANLTVGTGNSTAFAADLVLIEMIASYGMEVGASVFETCVWIGRMVEYFGADRCCLIYRRDVKLTLCGTARAKDPNIRQTIIDRFSAAGGGKVPQIGTKAKPGPLYGVSSHAWSALALAVAFEIDPSIAHAVDG